MMELLAPTVVTDNELARIELTNVFCAHDSDSPCISVCVKCPLVKSRLIAIYSYNFSLFRKLRVFLLLFLELAVLREVVRYV